MATCGACGKRGIRKTSMMFVIERGKVVGRRVGDCCSSHAVTIVNSTIAPPSEGAKAERLGQREALAPFIRLLAGRLKAHKGARECFGGSTRDFTDGCIEELENVISMLKRRAR